MYIHDSYNEAKEEIIIDAVYQVIISWYLLGQSIHHKKAIDQSTV